MTAQPKTIQIANRFKIDNLHHDLLGQGGMGNVYLGTDCQTGAKVAIKSLKPEVVRARPDMLARFEREGKVLRQLNHPNIVKMLATVEEAGRYYLIMDYVRGGSLRAFLAGQTEFLPLNRVLEIGLDLSDALARTHRLNIIHRDLKPANVLLDTAGTPLLTDFGAAQVADDLTLTQPGELIGTPYYLSPEACRNQKLDARTDIWAFGVLLYQLLTGKRPFSGTTHTAVLSAILTQPPPDISQLRPDLPQALVKLLSQMLEKELAKRLPSVRLVGTALEAILSGFSSSGPEETVTVMPVAKQKPPQLSLTLPVLSPSKLGPTTGNTASALPLAIQGNVVSAKKVTGDKIIVGDVLGNGVAIGGQAQVTISRDIGLEQQIKPFQAILFQAVYQQIEIRAPDPDLDKDELSELVKKIQQEIARGVQANTRKIKRWFNTLSIMAPDISREIVTGLLHPTIDITPTIRQIAAQAGSDLA